ncbi:HAMP domain-containing protein [Oscillochloris sp. ZM17-4]|uniref:ATP-binding protein n=1 Tax=Oscillochloris sp. ZM17-4 TaxID=2866714 RepID=UPI001C737E35|nr:ATP-binding protein [Oscillochloris sp. ZM17-4]MBX0326466.1 HAMP domain-containing protein [Oscillochloris sp. ZM17-4]
MRLLTRIVARRISTKIILPYLLLAVLLAMAMTLVAARFTAGSLQDRLNARLVEVGQMTSDGLVAVEDRQIEELRTIAFTAEVAEAVDAGDAERLATLLRPIWANFGLHALVIFDTSGHPLLSWRRADGAGVGAMPARIDLPDLADWWLVGQIIDGRSDAFGDKFSAFREDHLWTSAPIRRGETLVGGVMVATPLDELLAWLQGGSQAAVTTFYDGRGVAVATTQILVGEARVAAIPLAQLEALIADRAAAEPIHIQSVASLNGREYQFAYSPLRVRRTMDGFFSVALARSPLTTSWEAQRTPLIALSLALLAAVIAVGALVARQITRPLRDLVLTARAVAEGDLKRRSGVCSHDEVGALAGAFNQMTSRLLHLYETSRALSAQPQAQAILAQTDAAVRGLVPGAVTLAILRSGAGWRINVIDGGDEQLARLGRSQLSDSVAVESLSRRAVGMIIAPSDARRFRSFGLPLGYAEICYTALTVQGQLVGLLLLLHRERGGFVESVREPLGAIAGMAASALNNVRLYAEVRSESQRRTAILESIADGVILCDAERNVILINPAALGMLELDDWPRRRYHLSQLPLQQIVGDGLHASDTPARYMCHGRVLSASFAPLAGGGGEVIGLHDVSVEAALDQAKTDLIALISHELRTPLTAIQGATDMLRKEIGGTLTPLQHELADTAMRQSLAMSSLIDKAILVAGLEMGTLELDVQPTGVQTVLDLAVAPLRQVAVAAGVDLSIVIAPDLPLVQADVRMLKFAVAQLIDNALKYGEGQPVKVLARRHRGGVALAVRDYGPGIAAERLPQLFERLRRSEGALNEGPRGIGLGLMLSRELLERQGGAISVQSRAGQGSLFTIFLRGADQGNKAIAA